jgi:Bacterial membrane protein YfhO
MKKLRPEIGTLSLIIGFILLAYWKVIFTRGYTYFAGADLGGQYYPWYQFAGWSWKNGSVPLWDPFVRSGRLFFDEMQQGAFYPLNILLFLLPAKNGGVDLWSMDFLIVLSVLGAGLGEYFLLRSLKLSSAAALIGSTIFALGGYTAFVVGHQSILEGVIWLPWIVLFFLKALDADGNKQIRFTVTCGFLLGMSLLAGHIQPPIHICLILGFFTLSKIISRNQNLRSGLSAAGVLIGTIVFSAAVAAVQLIPSYFYSLIAYRWVSGIKLNPGQTIPFQLQEIWSPAEYLSLIVPSATSHQFYFGIAALFLAFGGALAGSNRFRRLFLVGGLLSFLYSWGKLSAIYSAVYLTIPFAEKVPEASRSVFIFQFFLAGLAAMGGELLASPVPKIFRRRFEITATTILAAANIILAVVLIAGFLQVRRTGVITPESHIPYSIAAIMLALTAGIIFLRKYRMIRLKTMSAALTLIVAFDLISFVQVHTPQKNAESADHVYTELKTIAFLRSLPGMFRVADMDDSLPLNFGDSYHIQTTGGYGASLRKDYLDFLSESPDPDSAMRMLNVRYYVGKRDPGSLTRIYKDDQTGVSVYEDSQALPRIAFVAADGTFAPDKIGEYLLKTRRIGSESQIASYKPNEIVAVCNAASSGYLWLSELAYRGWRATVDGQPSTVLISDGIFRTVPVPAGEHTVRLVFRPTSVYVGAAISLFACLLFLALSISAANFRSDTDARRVD